MRRLGVWPRLGIVLTVAWLIAGSALFYLREVGRWGDAARAVYADCLRLEPGHLVVEQCAAQQDASLQRLDSVSWEFLWGGIGLAALIAAVAWAVAGLTYLAARWILAGRKPPTP